MAISGTLTELDSNSSFGTTNNLTFTAPTSGDVIIWAASTRGWNAGNTGGTITIPSGFTPLQTNNPENAGDVSGIAVAYKVSDGTETQANASIDEAPSSWRCVAYTVDQTDLNTGSIVSNIDSTGSTSAVDTQSSGAASNTVNDALAVAIWSHLRWDFVDGGTPTYSNSFLVSGGGRHGNGSEAAQSWATKVLTATGSQSSTYDNNETNTPMQGVIVIINGTSSGVTTITDIEGGADIAPGQTAVTITGTNFEASQGTGGVRLNSQSDGLGIDVGQTETSWSDTSIDFTVVHGNLKYGTVYAFVKNNSTDENTVGFPVTLTTASGYGYTNLVSPGTTAEHITATAAMATGDQVEYESTSTSAAYPVVVEEAASFTIEAANPSGETFDFRVHDGTSWGTSATQTIGTFIDTTPSAFDLVDLIDVAVSTSYESNEIVVLAVAAGQNIALSITGGEYAIDSGSGYGAWATADTNVQLNHKVKVRHTSSSENLTQTQTLLTIGGVADLFTTTTRAAASTTKIQSRAIGRPIIG
jgi:hypothetical protein